MRQAKLWALARRYDRGKTILISLASLAAATRTSRSRMARMPVRRLPSGPAWLDTRFGCATRIGALQRNRMLR